MTTIRLTERVTLDEVIAWELSTCTVFKIGRRAAFEPGAQGLALAMLAGLDPTTHDFALECEFEEPKNLTETAASPFFGAYGFALTRLARRIFFTGRPASNSFKPLLSTVYKDCNGVMGTGLSRSIVCADPVFSLPPALPADLVAEAGTPFPPPSSFSTLLHAIVKDMGFRRLLGSHQESSIVDFVYEALRNSLEHGMPESAARKSRSTRALIIDKVVLQTAVLDKRHVSPEFKEYLDRIAEANAGELGLGIACFTVADQGEGIQGTLPPDEGETEDARLLRAFEPGESRKPAGVVSRGLGLPKVVASSHHLQALIRVSSGELIVGQDFSTGESKYPKLSLEALRRMREGFRCGTSISIFVPEYGRDLDQVSLFKK